MERDQELKKLTNVLRRIARAAHYAASSRAEPDAARFCAAQYNRVLKRVTELEPAVAAVFTPLPEAAAPEVIAMASRELTAFFEDDAERGGEEPRRRPRARVVVLGGHRFGRRACG